MIDLLICVLLVVDRVVHDVLVRFAEDFAPPTLQRYLLIDLQYGRYVDYHYLLPLLAWILHGDGSLMKNDDCSNSMNMYKVCIARLMIYKAFVRQHQAR